MDFLGKVGTAVAAAVGTVAWFIPNCTASQKVIFTLSVIVIYLSVYAYRINKKLKDSLHRENETVQRHTALADQFDEKIKLERRYRQAFAHFEAMLVLACSNTKEIKLTNMYKTFTMIKDRIDDGGD